MLKMRKIKIYIEKSLSKGELKPLLEKVEMSKPVFYKIMKTKSIVELTEFQFEKLQAILDILKAREEKRKSILK